MSLLFVVVMGIVEGLTEFLPISSTGHLILTAHAFGLSGNAKVETFEIFIQLGAILAVFWEYRRDLWRMATRVTTDRGVQIFLAKVFVAFLPAAVVGLAFRKVIKAHLFHVGPVAAALVVGGIFIFAIEQFLPKRKAEPVEKVSWLQALGIGLFQCLALWPGFSRSAATILGGMTLGLDRSRSTIFSFYLALPTLGAATLYELAKATSEGHVTAEDAMPLAIGTAVSFVVALLVIKGMLWYVRQYDFRPLAVYRIVLGIIVMAVRPPMEQRMMPLPESRLRQPQVEAAAFARRER